MCGHWLVYHPGIKHSLMHGHGTHKHYKLQIFLWIYFHLNCKVHKSYTEYFNSLISIHLYLGGSCTSFSPVTPPVLMAAFMVFPSPSTYMTGYYLEYHIVASVILTVRCLTCLKVTTLHGLIRNNYMTRILLTQKT